MKNYFMLTILAVVMFNTTSSYPSAATMKEKLEVVTLAHRGASGYAPEHTFAAYELAKRMKADYIEIDLQMTKDGELIAMHDESVDRTTNGKGLVKDLSLKDVKKLDAGSWFNEVYPDKARKEYVGLKVPTLREVLQEFSLSCNLYIETKSPELNPGLEEKLIDVLKEYSLLPAEGKSGRIMIQSFSPDSLKKLHQLDDSLPLIQLLSYYTHAVIGETEIEKLKKYAVGIGMHFTAINPSYVKKVRDAGLLIHPYTVNDPNDMKMLLDWGVTGMFTNYPDQLYEVIRDKTSYTKRS